MKNRLAIAIVVMLLVLLAGSLWFITIVGDVNRFVSFPIAVIVSWLASETMNAYLELYPQGFRS